MPQAAFIAGLPQSPIVYSPYTAKGTLKDSKDMAYGLERAKDVLYNMYRTGALSQDEYNLCLLYTSQYQGKSFLGLCL